MNKFKVGDRVEDVALFTGKRGTVIGESKYSDMILVQYDNKFREGHNGNGDEKYGQIGKDGRCYYVYEKQIKLIESTPQPFTLIIRPDKSNPDITTATLKLGKDTIRTESVKRHYKDAYDRGAAIKAVVGKMMPVREVQRKAKVGEYIKIVEAKGEQGCYGNGEIHKVTYTYSGGTGSVRIKTAKPMFQYADYALVKLREYLVLENYRPNCSTSAVGETVCEEPVKVELPKPIMIGGVELKVGSKFMIKKRADVSTTDGIFDSNWDKLYRLVLTVTSIRYHQGISEMVVGIASVGDFQSSYWFRVSAIDRIIED